MDNPYLLAVDIGSTKVCALAARRNEMGAIEVIGIGAHPCSGLSAMGISDLDDIVVSVNSACQKALSHAPHAAVRQAVVGVSGTFIECVNASGAMTLSNHGRAVTPDDVNRCVEIAKRKAVPREGEVIQAIPRGYRLDGALMRDPAGAEGRELEVDVHLVSGRQTVVRNLCRCVQMAGLGVEELVFQPIASSYSVLSEEERRSGVALAEIGGETTTLLVWAGGGIQYGGTIELGGEDITRDLNHHFQTPMDNAERLKKFSGTAWRGGVDPGETVEVVRFKNRRTIVVKKAGICEIIEARVEQIFDQVAQRLTAHELWSLLHAGIVITGGTSLMDGIREKARETFQLEVQIGYPNGVAGFEPMITSPSHAAAIGLLHYGYRRRDEAIANYGQGWRRVFRRAVHWLHQLM